MAREDAINTLKENLCGLCAYGSQNMESCDIRGCDNREAIKTLEQESCEDLVNRQAVFETIDDCNKDGLKGIFCSYDDGERFKEYIKKLPSVTPTPKKGKWENLDFHHYYNDSEIETVELRCSCCNEIVEWDIESPHKPYYCENCGSRNGE